MAFFFCQQCIKLTERKVVGVVHGMDEVHLMLFGVSLWKGNVVEPFSAATQKCLRCLRWKVLGHKHGGSLGAIKSFHSVRHALLKHVEVVLNLMLVSISTGLVFLLFKDPNRGDDVMVEFPARGREATFFQNQVTLQQGRTSLRFDFSIPLPNMTSTLI